MMNEIFTQSTLNHELGNRPNDFQGFWTCSYETKNSSIKRSKRKSNNETKAIRWIWVSKILLVRIWSVERMNVVLLEGGGSGKTDWKA